MTFQGHSAKPRRTSTPEGHSRSRLGNLRVRYERRSQLISRLQFDDTEQREANRSRALFTGMETIETDSPCQPVLHPGHYGGGGGISHLCVR